MGGSADNAGRWRDAIYELAAFARPSASDGEKRGAELIAARLRELGCEVQVDQERAHGGYWWPIALANSLAAAGALVALRKRGPLARVAGAAAAAVSAAALWDDLGHGSRWFRRRLLPRRHTWNVVAEAGDASARRTVMLVAHHDAAHSGLVFHPALGRIGPRLFPAMHERSSHTLPILYGTWLGPVMIGLGGLVGSRRLLRAGATLALGATAVMADIGAHPVVPGANDNLSAVGVLLALAAKLQAEPLDGLRVLLVSTGSEESFSEGMQAFGERHFRELDPAQTEMVCLECLGGPTLIVLEGEGMLRMRDYPQRMRDRLAEAASAAGVEITRGIRTVAATDAIIALRAGYPVATLASIDDTKLPLNYHWPSDVPDAMRWDTIEDAIALCEALVRQRSAAEPAHGVDDRVGVDPGGVQELGGRP
jgi:hypothetical protein